MTKVYRYEHGGEFPCGMSGSRISGFDWEKGLILSPTPGMSPLLADFLGFQGLSGADGGKDSRMRPARAEQDLKGL